MHIKLINYFNSCLQIYQHENYVTLTSLFCQPDDTFLLKMKKKDNFLVNADKILKIFTSLSLLHCFHIAIHSQTRPWFIAILYNERVIHTKK